MKAKPRLPQTFAEYLAFTLAAQKEGINITVRIEKLGASLFGGSDPNESPSPWVSVICSPKTRGQLMAQASTVGQVFTHARNGEPYNPAYFRVGLKPQTKEPMQIDIGQALSLEEATQVVLTQARIGAMCTLVAADKSWVVRPYAVADKLSGAAVVTYQNGPLPEDEMRKLRTLGEVKEKEYPLLNLVSHEYHVTPPE